MLIVAHANRGWDVHLPYKDVLYSTILESHKQYSTILETPQHDFLGLPIHILITIALISYPFYNVQ